MNIANKDEFIINFIYYLDSQRISLYTKKIYTQDIKLYLDSILNNLENIIDIQKLENFIRGFNITSSTSKRRKVSIKKMIYFIKTLDSSINVDFLVNNIANFKNGNNKLILQNYILNQDELNLIFNYKSNLINHKRDKAIIETMYTLGLRIEELSNLNLDDIDLHLKLISFFRKNTKTSLLLNESNNSSLIEYINERRRKNINCEYLFLSSQNYKLSRQSIWKIVIKYCNSAGIKTRITPKILRKSFAIYMIKNGISINYVSNFFGVENISFLLNENISNNINFDIKNIKK